MESAMTTRDSISIVDDDPSVREGLTDLLNSMGFATESFQCAEDFLASDRIDRTACLITDGCMTGMTGFELYQHLLTCGKRVPTILITAFANQADRARALQAGMYCYLPKPFNQHELLACLRCALASHRIVGAP
jgi:FixJ family two-component response regulator